MSTTTRLHTIERWDESTDQEGLIRSRSFARRGGGRSGPRSATELIRQTPNTVLLGDLLRQQGGMPAARFAELFPHPFLIQITSLRDLEQGDPRTGTVRSTMPQPKESNLLGCPVYFVKKRETNPLTNLISVGRTANNDLPLPYHTVSKFHAYFQVHDWSLVDAGSSNGTYMGRKRLEPRAPQALGESCEISFSKGCSFLFLQPDRMSLYLKHLEALENRLPIAPS